MSSIRIEETTFYNIEDAVPDTPEIAEYDLIEFFLICCIVISTITYLKKCVVEKYTKKQE